MFYTHSVLFLFIVLFIYGHIIIDAILIFSSEQHVGFIYRTTTSLHKTERVDECLKQRMAVQ